MAFNSPVKTTINNTILPNCKKMNNSKLSEQILSNSNKKLKKNESSKSTNNGFKFFDVENQFKAACDAIQNLPKNGRKKIIDLFLSS